LEASTLDGKSKQLKKTNKQKHIYGSVAKILYTFNEILYPVALSFKSSTSFVCFLSIQIWFSTLCFTLIICTCLFWSCPSSLPCFFTNQETRSAFRPVTYGSLADNYLLLIKPCLCYAVYLAILLKLQYCYFTFFPLWFYII